MGGMGAGVPPIAIGGMGAGVPPIAIGGIGAGVPPIPSMLIGGQCLIRCAGQWNQLRLPVTLKQMLKSNSS
jgi:hypothetical protein